MISTSLTVNELIDETLTDLRERATRHTRQFITSVELLKREPTLSNCRPLYIHAISADRRGSHLPLHINYFMTLWECMCSPAYVSPDQNVVALRLIGEITKGNKHITLDPSIYDHVLNNPNFESAAKDLHDKLYGTKLRFSPIVASDIQAKLGLETVLKIKEEAK